MQELKINPTFRDLIPPLSPYELEALEAEIRHWARAYAPIITWNGTIVDGHHRYEICKKYNLPFKVQRVEDAHNVKFEDENDAEIWILENNFARRNLNDFLKGELILALKPRLKKQAEKASKSNLVQFQVTDNQESTDFQNFGSRTPKSQKEWHESRVDAKLGKKAGISREQVRKIDKLKEEGICTDEEIKQLREGKVRISKKFMEKRRDKRVEDLKATEFPEGKYRVIYADPPWDYKTGENSKNTADPELQYPVMSLEAICDLPVKEIADENAVLFLWTTSYHIFESKAVLDAWGFEYKSMFIWDKVKHNMGCYNSVRHELLLIATKGSCTPDNVELIDSVQSIERTRHSEKPEEFRKIIETLYKYGNKVECFARKQTEGWDAYGNECS